MRKHLINYPNRGLVSHVETPRHHGDDGSAGGAPVPFEQEGTGESLQISADIAMPPDFSATITGLGAGSITL